MLSVLILISIASTVLVGALCAQIYKQQSKLLAQFGLQREMLSNLDSTLQRLATQQLAAYKRIDQLAIDVLQREMYKSSDDRHQMAISSAKQGQGLFELTQRHGLSSDEAALIVSLHAPQDRAPAPSVKNANLQKPTVLDEI